MISGLVTTTLLLAFLGIAAWAYSAHNRTRFEEAAQLPLKDDVPLGAESSHCCHGRQNGARS
ncbi:CcoQ/FixQ family Cbb3-type cytochrome c oxidase assembly chaperone [Solimonas variicoloris]|uniref:CcoQ/FixQ family Cbb3-type cytochrome c oxidase assembly chaperone n=1 Tax=Solimonas variicoloris TaxID=254408 RepID=UPI000371E762|nr:CcoQ/FixQ family Cbb3-type cytochrome c oxidase assembly chaperone [Solimonas variicoloris]